MRIVEKTPAAKEALMQAAETLFAQKSYSAVSTRDIAELAGVNLGAIQYYFGSKAALFVSVFNSMADRGGSECACRHAAPTNREEALRSIISFVHSLSKHLIQPSGPGVCRMLFREILGEAGSETELGESLSAAIVERYTKPAEKSLLVSLKILAPHLSEPQHTLMARSIIGQCFFYLSHRPLLELMDGKGFLDGEKFDALVQHVIEFSFRGLGLQSQEFSSVVADQLQQLRSNTDFASVA